MNGGGDGIETVAMKRITRFSAKCLLLDKNQPTALSDARQCGRRTRVRIDGQPTAGTPSGSIGAWAHAPMLLSLPGTLRPLELWKDHDIVLCINSKHTLVLPNI